MLSTSYLISASTPNKNDSDKSGRDNKEGVRRMVLTFFVLLVLDLVILVYSTHCIFECSQVKKWPMLLTILLMVMLFIPTVGTLTSFGVIIYYHVSCKAGVSNMAPLSNPDIGNQFRFY